MDTLVSGVAGAAAPLAVLDWIVTLHPVHAASLALTAVAVVGTAVYAWRHHTGRCHAPLPFTETLNARSAREVEEARR